MITCSPENLRAAYRAATERAKRQATATEQPRFSRRDGIRPKEKPPLSTDGLCLFCGAERHLRRKGRFCSEPCRKDYWQRENRPGEFARRMAKEGKVAA